MVSAKIYFVKESNSVYSYSLRYILLYTSYLKWTYATKTNIAIHVLLKNHVHGCNINMECHFINIVHKSYISMWPSSDRNWKFSVHYYFTTDLFDNGYIFNLNLWVVKKYNTTPHALLPLSYTVITLSSYLLKRFLMPPLFHLVTFYFT